MITGRAGLSLFLLAVATASAAERVAPTWPTPNTAWAENRPLGDYLQHAGSGDPESGGFGGVRSASLATGAASRPTVSLR